MLMLLSLLACGGCGGLDAPQTLTFDTHQAQQVGGKFRDEPDIPLEPRVAFDVEGRCPKLDRVDVVQVNPTIRDVTIYGTNLPSIRRVGGVLPDGKLVNAQFERRGDGLYFPVACERCEIYFGIGAPAPDPERAPGVPPLGGAGAAASQGEASGVPVVAGGAVVAGAGGPAAGAAPGALVGGPPAAGGAVAADGSGGGAPRADTLAGAAGAVAPATPGVAGAGGPVTGAAGASGPVGGAGAGGPVAAGGPATPGAAGVGALAIPGAGAGGPVAAGGPATPSAAAGAPPPPRPAFRTLGACLGPGYSLRFEDGKVVK